MDTGFSGDLILPPDAVARIGLEYENRTPLYLADGQEIEAAVHLGCVKWLGREREVNVLALDGQPLLGMTLLAGCKITIHARPGGEALIEEDGEA